MDNFYEILVIASPDETDEGIDAIIGGMRQQLAASSGDVIDINRWGRRKLAYPIRKHTEGVYLLIHVAGPAALPGEFRNYTKIRESILREMAVRLSDLQVEAARQAIAERGPVDEGLAESQMEAADQRAAAKRAEAETSVSEREEATESDDAAATADDAGATADDAGATADDESASADETVAADDDNASVEEVVAETDDADAPAEAVDDDTGSDDSDDESADSDDEPAGEAPPAEDSSDGAAEGEPQKED